MSLHEDLKAYLDGELDSVRAEEVKTALERDPGLRRELSELRSLSEHLQGAAAEIRINGLEKTLAALERSDRSRRSGIERLLWGGGLAVAAAFVWVMLFPVFSQAKQAAKKTHWASLANSAKDSGDVSEDLKAQAPETTATPPTQDFARAKAFKSLTRRPLASGKMRELSANQNVPHNDKTAGEIALQAPSRGAQGAARSKATNAEPPASMTPLGNSTAEGTITSIVVKAERKVPTTVTLSFASKDDGIKQVLGVVGKYRVPRQIPTLSDKRGKDPTLTELATSEIMAEIPEDQADQVIGDLKRLGLAQQPVGRGGMTMTRGAVTLNNGLQAKNGATSNSSASLSAPAGKAPSGNLAKSASGPGAPADANSTLANSNLKRPEANLVDNLAQKNRIQRFAARNTNAANVSSSTTNVNTPRMRLLRIVIEEKPKNDPVP